MLSNRSWLSMCLGAALCFTTLGCKGSGVDLSKGGTELVYKANLPAGEDEAKTMAAARKVVLARLEALKAPASVLIDGQTLRVRIPKKVAAEKLEYVKALMAIHGKLEFREVDDGAAIKAISDKLNEESPIKIEQDTWTDANQKPRGAFVFTSDKEETVRTTLATIAEFKAPAGTELMLERPMVPDRVRMYLVRESQLGNDAVKGFSAAFDQYLPPEVAMSFSPEGSKKFAEFTEKILGRKMAIVVDGQIQETAVVMTPITGGRASLTQGDEGEDRKLRQRKAEVLASALRGGIFPVPLTFQEEREIAKR